MTTTSRSTMPIVLVWLALLSSTLDSACDDRNETNEHTRQTSVTRAEPSQGPRSPDAPVIAPPPSSVPGDQDLASLAAYCPMSMPGATMERIDTTDGVTLDFTVARLEDVIELRRRVRELARAYEEQRPVGPGMNPMGPGMKGHARMGGPEPMPKVQATVTDIDLGARLELTPVDSARLEDLREQVHRHERHMRRGTCPPPAMIHRGPGAGPRRSSPDESRR